MSNQKNNESQDTLQFKVPKVPADEGTKIFRVPQKGSRNGNRPSQSPVRNTTPQNPQRQRPAGSRPQHTSQASQTQGRSQQHNAGRTGAQATRPQTQRKTASSSQSSRRHDIPPVPQSAQNHTPVKKKRKKSAGRFFRNIIIFLILIFVGYSALSLYYITKLSPIEETGQYVNNEENLLYSSDVKNILIIGTDARDTSTRGLSDSMILLSVNKKNHKLQMTSFMRDMYTEIDGYDCDKLNAAYSYGGAELLKDTIEDNFKIRIDGCMTVNFLSVAYIVDAVGGVEITLSDSEAQAVNDILYSEVNGIMGDAPDADFLDGGGTKKLSGKQALSYSRIRYVGDADFERTQRQRTVISQLLAKLKHINPVTLHSNMKKALPYIGSDMNVAEMYFLALRLPSLLIGYDIEQMRVPADDTWSFSETWDGQSIIEVDFSANTQILKEKIYLQ